MIKAFCPVPSSVLSIVVLGAKFDIRNEQFAPFGAVLNSDKLYSGEVENFLLPFPNYYLERHLSQGRILRKDRRKFEVIWLANSGQVFIF